MENETFKPRPEEENNIMTYTEYVELEHPIPYTFELLSGEKTLTYFGAAHSNDPESPMFQEIERRIKDKSPDIILVEGKLNLAKNKGKILDYLSNKDREEVISLGGEVDFTIKLAAELGIEVECPEPDLDSQIEHLLLKGFDRETIFTFFVTEKMRAFKHLQDRFTEEEFIKHAISDFESKTSWKNFTYSEDLLATTQLDILGEGIDYKSDYSHKLWPIPSGLPEDKWTAFNELSRTLSRFRDEVIVLKIKDLSQKYNNLFIVYGASHAVMQEPALRAMFK